MSRTTIRLATFLAASATSLALLLAFTGPGASAARTATSAVCHLGIIKTIKAGFGGQATVVAYDQGSGEIYVAGEGGVEAINGQTYKETALIATGKAPNAIAVNPGTHTIYVANSGSGTVSVINGSTSKVKATVHVGNIPLAVAVDRLNGNVYATGLDGVISVINARTNKVTGTIQLRDDIEAAALSQRSGLLYASNDSFPGVPGTIYVVDVHTRRIVARIRPGGNSRPYVIAVNPIRNDVYVTDSPNPGADGVFVISGRKIIDRISTGLIPGGIAVNPINGVVYVITAAVEGNTLLEIDGRSDLPISTFQFNDFDEIGFETVNAPARLVYVTDQTGELYVLNGCRPPD